MKTFKVPPTFLSADGGGGGGGAVVDDPFADPVDSGGGGALTPKKGAQEVLTEVGVGSLNVGEIRARKKMKKKAKKQQQLLEMQIQQIEETEREGKPLMNVRLLLLFTQEEIIHYQLY